MNIICDTVLKWQKQYIMEVTLWQVVIGFGSMPGLLLASHSRNSLNI
jgi:hypothetical protein